MSEWKEYKLGEICKVKGGKRLPKGNNLTTVPNLHPYIRVRDMGEKYLPINNLEYVPNEVFPSIKNYIVDKGDLLLSIVGTVGLVSLVNDELDKASLTENCVKIIPQKDIVDNEFLYYILKSNIGQEEIFRKIVGAVQPKLPIYNINNIGLNIPDLPTQTAIAEILSSLDDKIELNNKINQELENLAQTLFKQWFIDFEFPNENAEPYKSSGGEMVESELGEIPKGWEVNSLDGIADFLNGLALQKFPPGDEYDYLPVIKIRELRQRDTLNSDKASKSIPEKYIVQNGDVLFSWSGSLLVDFWTNGKGALNQHLFKVTSNQFPQWFYYLWTKHHLSEFIKIAESKATTMGHIQRQHLSDAKVVIPDEIPRFTSVFEPIISKIIENRIENVQLTNLRDTLLPKLISGELEVSQTQTNS
ncbi:MAG: restriction endonuclease subunit S [Chitinophagaceae bacterium]|nr:restriction endonuclease subunit S [Chitinophagaceae bacterium]